MNEQEKLLAEVKVLGGVAVILLVLFSYPFLVK